VKGRSRKPQPWRRAARPTHQAPNETRDLAEFAVLALGPFANRFQPQLAARPVAVCDVAIGGRSSRAAGQAPDSCCRAKQRVEKESNHPSTVFGDARMRDQQGLATN
jgi:hypothetical protein